MAGPISSFFNGIGNLISGGTWQQSGQELKQQEYNSAEAEKNREWQEQMRNTAVDSQVQQLERNGVNVASYFAGGGSGAATPSGATAHNTASAPQSEFASTLNAVANVANSFNRDKDKGNNINLKQALGMIANVASIFK